MYMQIEPLIELYGNVIAQSEIDDFYLVMSSAPVGREAVVMDVLYMNGEFSSIEKKFIKNKKPSKNIKSEYELINKEIDSLKLIDYKNDTIYVLSTYYIPSGSSSMTLKTQKGVYDLIKNRSGKYSIRPMCDNSYDLSNNDSLLYKVIFSWDIDTLIQLIKSSGAGLGGEYFISAKQIIIKDHRVISKEIVNFEPALIWKL